MSLKQDWKKKRDARILAHCKRMAVLKPFEASVSTGSKEGFKKRTIKVKANSWSYRSPITWHGTIK